MMNNFTKIGYTSNKPFIYRLLFPIYILMMIFFTLIIALLK